MRLYARCVRLLGVPLALALGSCSSGSDKVSTSAKENDLIAGVKVLYMANVNGEIEPCGCRGNPSGGIDRRFNFMQQKASGEKLNIDSGDTFYKSSPVPPFLEKQWNYQASVLVEAYNILGVDAFTPGELDFAAGVAQLEKLRSKAKFKFVSANIHRAENDQLLFEPYTVLKKGGKTIGVFGLYDEALELPEELTAKEHIAAARAVVEQLRGKVDVLIALTHLGLAKDQALARTVPGIDAIFGSHSQSFLIVPEKIGETLIFHPSFRGQHMGIYEDGENSMYQLDTRFESPSSKRNRMDKLLAEAKERIGRINIEMESTLMETPTVSTSSSSTEFQTFARCAECHTPQHDFHKKTAHFRAFETLIKAKQSANLDCLRCHTVGAQQEGGWTHVRQLVQNSAGKSIKAEKLAKSLPNIDPMALSKFSKTFINVQCENCHGPGNGHPFSGSLVKKVSTTTCLQCHTLERAPSWYKNGKPDPAILENKLKSVTCPSQ